MTKISDQMKGSARPTSTVSIPEGGDDMALALTSTVQAQANQLAIAAEAANISIDHASTQMAEYFTQVMSGQALLDATLAKTAANLQAMGGPIGISTDVQPITINLPESRDFAQTRRGFLGMFGAAPTEQNPFLAAAATAADEVASDD
jgi:hypothetical protein